MSPLWDEICMKPSFDSCSYMYTSQNFTYTSASVRLGNLDLLQSYISRTRRLRSWDLELVLRMMWHSHCGVTDFPLPYSFWQFIIPLLVRKSSPGCYIVGSEVRLLTNCSVASPSIATQSQRDATGHHKFFISISGRGLWWCELWPGRSPFCHLPIGKSGLGGDSPAPKSTWSSESQQDDTGHHSFCISVESCDNVYCRNPFTNLVHLPAPKIGTRRWQSGARKD